MSESQVILDELVLRAPMSPPTGAPTRRDSTTVLSFESVDLPTAAAPGATLPITLSWRSKADGAEDHAQFLHLGHVETGDYFVYDQRPLGDRLPTRLWYSGLADSETWSVPLPADLAPGEYRVSSGLYRVSDGRARAGHRRRGGSLWLDNRVALGGLTIAG